MDFFMKHHSDFVYSFIHLSEYESNWSFHFIDTTAFAYAAFKLRSSVELSNDEIITYIENVSWYVVIILFCLIVSIDL